VQWALKVSSFRYLTVSIYPSFFSLIIVDYFSYVPKLLIINSSRCHWSRPFQSLRPGVQFVAPAPDYLSTMCHPVSRLPGRQNLRSANRGQLDVPRATLSSCGVRAFAHAGPSLLNTLPVLLKNRNLTLTTFMHHLKSYLFSQYWFRIERVWGVIT